MAQVVGNGKLQWEAQSIYRTRVRLAFLQIFFRVCCAGRFQFLSDLCVRSGLLWFALHRGVRDIWQLSVSWCNSYRKEWGRCRRVSMFFSESHGFMDNLRGFFWWQNMSRFVETFCWTLELVPQSTYT